MLQDDAIRLCRYQRADVYIGADTARLIADHPLNAPLMGIQSAAEFARLSELPLQPCDKTVVVYGTKAGTACRAATATVTQRRTGRLCLTDWRLEPGFAHKSMRIGDRMVHRIVPVDHGSAAPKPVSDAD
jgi:DTW domain-containing protein YfiP